jgi:hypothetical protein
MAHPEKRTPRSNEFFDEVGAIGVVAKENIAIDRARRDVKEPIVKFAPWPSRHGRLITKRIEPGLRLTQTRGEVVPVP